MFDRFNRKHWPELDRFENEAEREAALLRAKKAATRGWRQFLVRLTLVALVAVGITLLARISFPFNGKNHLIYLGPLRTIITLVAAAAVHHWLLRHQIARLLFEDMDRSGKPTCLKCGYDLRGNPEFPGNPPLLRCPECGARHVMFHGNEQT